MPVLAPVVAALSSVLVAGGVTAAVATFAAQVIVTVGLAIGSAALSRLLSPRQKPPGQEFEMKTGANTPVWCVYGRQKLAGHAMPPVQLARSVVHVRNIGVGWHDALEYILIDGQRLRFVGVAGQWSNAGTPFIGIGGSVIPTDPVVQAGDPPVTAGIQAAGPGGSAWFQTVEFGSNVRIKFYDGRPTQTADSYLTDNSQQDAQANKHWEATHAGNSVCRVLVEITPDTNKNLSANPQIEFIVRGRRLWDPRKDTTYGGTGSHTRANPATWEWSDNCALAATDYRLGLYLNGVKVLGIGTPISRIRMDSRIAAANLCDTMRPLLGDEEEPMWRIAAVISNERTHRDNLQVFMDAMAGWETERGGTYRLNAGGPQTPVVAITDADLAKAPVRYRAQKPISERYNGVEGKFADPFNGYELQDLPIRRSSADEAVDMGERRLLPMTLSQVPSETQAQHLMEIARRRQRLQASATIAVPPRLRNPEIMDTISWVSAWHGGESREFMITNPWRKNRDMTLTWGLVETSAGIWDWDPDEDQLSRLVAADLPGAAPKLQTVAGFGISANFQTGADGQRIPIFIVTWAPISDQTVDGILVRYRPVGATEWAQKRFDGADSLAAGEGKIDSGIMAETEYEFEAELITNPPRFVTVVAPGPVVSDPNHVVRRARVTDTVAPAAIDWTALDLATRRGLAAIAEANTRRNNQIAELAAQVQSLEQQVEGNRFKVTERVRSVQGQASAQLIRANNIQAGINEATAEILTSLSSQVNDPATGLPVTRASFLDFQSTQVTLNSATATSLSTLSASLGTTNATLTSFQSAQATTNGAVSTSLSGLTASYNGISAGGQISMVALAGTAGFSAFYEVRIFAGGTSAAYRMTVTTGGLSGIDFIAARTRFIADDGSAFATFDSATKTLFVDRIKSGDINKIFSFSRAVPSSTHNIGSGTTAAGVGNSFISSSSLGTIVIPENAGAIGDGAAGSDYCPVICMANVKLEQSSPSYAIAFTNVEYRVRLTPSSGPEFTVAVGLIQPTTGLVGGNAAYGYHPATPGSVASYNQVKAGTYNVFLDWRFGNDSASGVVANIFAVKLSGSIILDPRRR